jgi:hypothetical protein
MKSLKDLKKEQPVWLTIYWCDRCGKAINQNEDKNHFHAEQCGCCKKFYWCDRCGKAINQNEDKNHFHAEQCGCCKKYRQIDLDWVIGG